MTESWPHSGKTDKRLEDQPEGYLCRLAIYVLYLFLLPAHYTSRWGKIMVCTLVSFVCVTKLVGTRNIKQMTECKFNKTSTGSNEKAQITKLNLIE